MKIYLDNCCYNRPYDTQMQLRISIETQAKLMIQELIKNGNIELVSSFAIQYEQDRNPFLERRDTIINFIKKYAHYIINPDIIETIENMTEPIMKTGIKRLDAYHVACAIYSECDYFITVDDRLLKYQSEQIKLINPIEFITRWEESE
ncbi:MAG: type II toxin-antitoxin system VapC family toxin [Lachnospiraceae bacterium]|nr:type II toxin-antitoxin system VapC family toxin [Lachnospiraceae bacterium]